MSGMLLKHVRGAIERHRLFAHGDRLVVGVSGGLDSMVLLHLLFDLRFELALSLIVAHVNHGLRPSESEAEARLVQRTSERLGLIFEYGDFDVKSFQKARSLCLQDAARRIRFQFFNDLLRKHEAQKIVLGHTADDQVETVLLRLIRGTGLRGLRGMLPSREGKVIRPLLEVWRKEIEAYAAEQKIPYLTDSSNLKDDYLRNRLRQKLIPLIERDYQPNFKKLILKTSELLREDDEILEKESSRAYREMVQDEKGRVSFRYSEFLSLPRGLRRRFLRRCLSNLVEGGEEGALDWIDQRLVQAPASFCSELPRGISVEKRYDQVLLSQKRVLSIPPFEVELQVPGRTWIEAIKKSLVTTEMERRQLPEHLEHPHLAYLDYENLAFPLIARNFRPGDRFQPMGVHGPQKLKEFFIDHKIPRFERASIPLIVSGGEIVWVVGHRISEKVKIGDRTQKVLRVEIA